jgi:hypothetical protein
LLLPPIKVACISLVDDFALPRYQFQSSLGHFETKEARLSDADTVWTNVRHMHMRDAIDKLMADFNAFLKEHGGFSAKSVAIPVHLLDPERTLIPTLTLSTGKAL